MLSPTPSFSSSIKTELFLDDLALKPGHPLQHDAPVGLTGTRGALYKYPQRAEAATPWVVRKRCHSLPFLAGMSKAFQFNLYFLLTAISKIFLLLCH